jgi:hypothetical protein
LVAAIRAEHFKYDHTFDGEGRITYWDCCPRCLVEWPCDAARAADMIESYRLAAEHLLLRERARAERAEEQLRLCNIDQLNAEAEAGTWKNRWNDAVTHNVRLNDELRYAEARITAALERVEAYRIDPVALDVRAILRGE